MLLCRGATSSVRAPGFAAIDIAPLGLSVAIFTSQRANAARCVKPQLADCNTLGIELANRPGSRQTLYSSIWQLLVSVRIAPYSPVLRGCFTKSSVLRRASRDLS